MQWYKKSFLPALAIIILTFALSGCGTKKQTGAAGQYQQTPETGFPASETYCKNVLGAYNEWTRVKLPVTVNLRQPKSISLSATATMERGKSITISLRFIGMEVGVLYLTSDSLLAIDKFNKVYVNEPLKPLLGGFPANISNVQDLLLGRPFLLGNENTLSSVMNKFEYKANADSDSWILRPKSFPSGMEYEFAFHPISSLSSLTVKAGKHGPVTVFFTQAVSTPSGPMAPAVNIETQVGKTAIDASIKWNFQKARWGSDIDVKKPTIPRNAERIPASKLLKMLPSL